MRWLKRPGAPRRPRRGRWRRAVLPAAIVAAAVGGVAGAVQVSGLRMAQPAEARFAAAIFDKTAALGFAVAEIRVEGRETTAPKEILDALAADRGTPILAVDLARARRRLEALPWVRSAAVMRRLPDTLYVRLVERKPLALWQHSGKIELIDRDGGVIPAPRLDRFANLPLVVGEDAAGRAAELIDMLAAEPQLSARVTAAIRVGGRRWNLRLDNAIDVLLPEADPAPAWAHLARLEDTHKLLERRIEAIDLRLPDRLVLRVEPPPELPAPAAKKGRQAAKNI